MKREEIIAMAREAGFDLQPDSEYLSQQTKIDQFIEFVAAIRSATKEEDARICEKMERPPAFEDDFDLGRNEGVRMCADAILASK